MVDVSTGQLHDFFAEVGLTLADGAGGQLNEPVFTLCAVTAVQFDHWDAFDLVLSGGLRPVSALLHGLAESLDHVVAVEAILTERRVEDVDRAAKEGSWVHSDCETWHLKAHRLDDSDRASGRGLAACLRDLDVLAIVVDNTGRHGITSAIADDLAGLCEMLLGLAGLLGWLRLIVLIKLGREVLDELAVALLADDTHDVEGFLLELVALLLVAGVTVVVLHH